MATKTVIQTQASNARDAMNAGITSRTKATRIKVGLMRLTLREGDYGSIMYMLKQIEDGTLQEAKPLP